VKSHREDRGFRGAHLPQLDYQSEHVFYCWRVDTRQAARQWAEVWERGWREHDAATIAALYAEGAFWQQHPFREPEPDYLARVFAEEESAQCWFGTPIADGDQAAVPWSAQTRLKDGGAEDLAGVSLLRFRADGW
jgi:hypothetical protein